MRDLIQETNTRQEAIDMLVAYAQKLAENPRQ